MTGTVPQSLVWATDIDVLPLDRVVERRDRYLVVRSPSHPEHYWGNVLIFDDPPIEGDGSRWERCFEAEFECEPRVQHRAFGWDHTDGELGCAEKEFVSRGYQLEKTVGLAATQDSIRSHQRENREVTIRALDPRPHADQHLWHQVFELQVAGRDQSFEEHDYREFSRHRLEEYRTLFHGGRGAWFVALDPSTDQVQACCGVVVTGTRGRFQAVETAEAHRRKGICSRLVVEATRHSAERYAAEHFVIAADAEYHALGLYESLGFQRVERVSGVYRRPTTA
jgi:ribosomal protein S18 acetylase RimI-like enzyme